MRSPQLRSAVTGITIERVCYYKIKGRETTHFYSYLDRLALRVPDAAAFDEMDDLFG
jgi:hypothetical protein